MKINNMDTDYKYRFASHADIQQLQKLGLASYGQFKGVISEENWNGWELSFRNDSAFSNLLDRSTCFVCERANEIVGMAFLVPHGNPFLYFQSEWSYLRYVGVDPEHGGKGIGRELTQRCIDFARESGEKIIALHTSEFQNAARHIYESLGFRCQGELEKIYGKQYYLYTLQLS
jgi:ribosomal protein S18 acetylase RimI-like enzyme